MYGSSANRIHQHCLDALFLKVRDEGATTCKLANSAPIELPSAMQMAYLLATRMTPHFPYCSDKLSRLAMLSELFECHSTHRTGSLAEGGRLARFLRGWLALV